MRYLIYNVLLATDCAGCATSRERDTCVTTEARLSSKAHQRADR
jgi:hypothetical protein